MLSANLGEGHHELCPGQRATPVVGSRRSASQATGTIANGDTGNLLNLVGRIRFNGAGGVSMPFVRFSSAGLQYSSSGKGTYSLSSACTGSATLNFITNGNIFATARLQMVVSGTPDAPIIYAIYTDDGDTAESGELVFNLIQQ